jgi:iron complex outermembrane receptor protein
MDRSFRLPAHLLMVALLAAGSPATLLAQKSPADLALVSVEDLLNIEITSASRKEQRADAVPAAVYVITQDDIRRSGYTTLPDLFRLVPGMQVAQINGNKWAVSARGFNGLYADKLLVLVDGRTVYNRLFSGVLWDAEDILLEDVDRIEIIRGPGGAMWGANAVNGVINIVTRAATATQGAFVSARAGSFEPASGAVRYGGSFKGASYRAYSQWSSRGDSVLPGQASPHDNSHSVTSGARVDWAGAHDSFVVEGSGTMGRANALWLVPTQSLHPDASSLLPGGASDMTGGVLFGRWVRSGSGGASLQIQSSLDTAHRVEPVGEYHRTSADVELQYHRPLGTVHDLVAGLGYRFNDESFAGRNGYSVTPEASQLSIFNAFAQDDLALVARHLTLSLGAKIERDAYVGVQLEPTVRLLWTVIPQRQHAWAAVSRAVRTPSLQERGLRLDYPPVAVGAPLPLAVSILGNPAIRPETVVSFESGYRLGVGPVQIDIAGFTARYDALRTSEPQAPRLAFEAGGPVLLVPVLFDNLMRADTTGVEMSARWQPTIAWRLEGSYTGFHLTSHVDPASHDPAAPTFDGDAPRHQWQMRSLYTLRGRADLDVLLLHVGALALGVPAYTRADARIEWRLGSGLSAILAGQNLTDRSHAEFTSPTVQALATQMPRSVTLGLTWRSK